MKWLRHLIDIVRKKKNVRIKNTAMRLTAGAAEKGKSRWGVTTHKFPRAYKYRIAQLIAQCDITSEIMSTIKAETGIDISHSTVMQYKHSKKWAPIIAKEREIYLNNVAEIPGYHEKVRLERADKIYRYAIGSNNPELALKSIEQQRKEVKEKPTGPVSLTFNQYNGLTDEELNEKYDVLLKKIEEKKKRNVITIENKGESNGTSGV